MKKNMKKKSNPPLYIFPILLASIKSTTYITTYKKQKLNNNNINDINNNNNTSLKKINSYTENLQIKLLKQLNLLLNPNPNFQLIPILSLIPILLKSKCAEVVRRCVKFVGAVSLYSLEMNHQIADDEETVKSLISGLACRNKRSTLLATCNAVLDLATTSFGRQRLLDCSALNCIIASFLQVSKCSVPNEVTIFTKNNGNEILYRIGFKEDELLVQLIDAAITFVNSCQLEKLESIPVDLFKPFWAHMKNLWKTTRTQILLANNMKLNQQSVFFLSNITTDKLAESLFRLSINANVITSFVPLDVIKRSIFGQDQSIAGNFILNHWEDSPLLMRGSLKASNDQNDVLNSFRQCLTFNNAAPCDFSAILKHLISCPPIASDELDVLKVLNEVRGHLGSPMIYQQDVRVLKTPHLSGEIHYFYDSEVLYMDNIMRCEEAFKEGHTIALRGMEFRFEDIAAIVDGLAHLFGQPSAGANMYLTPPSSQGLARHYDDHCVFVCQLIGAKKWKVFPQLSLLLPKLYEPVNNLDDADGVSNEFNEYVLREGDILYIPRGFLHEACTFLENEKPEEEVGFSLHLTLAIEVEAPFEWGGFAHIALHNWFQKQYGCLNLTPTSLCHSLNVISMNLLHVAINLIGDKDPTFRKACLVGANSLPADGKDRSRGNQKSIFSHVIKTLDAKLSFSDALQIVTLSLGKNEDPFRNLRWLQNIDDDNEIFELKYWRLPPNEHEESFLLICNEVRQQAEASFMFVKSNFCNEVDFGESEKCYSGLLKKYRKVRNHYRNGMLSLHCK